MTLKYESHNSLYDSMGVYMKLVSIPNHPCSKKMKHNTPERRKNTNNIQD
jgi:hypothetical protein